LAYDWKDALVVAGTEENSLRGSYLQYNPVDFKYKKFDNPALVSNYPIDIHSKDKNSSKCEKIGEYQLPIESLMSNDYDNLFVIGKVIGADFVAHSALRVQKSCMSMGEGIAKYIANILI
jgi:hypothetical protein